MKINQPNSTITNQFNADIMFFEAVNSAPDAVDGLCRLKRQVETLAARNGLDATASMEVERKIEEAIRLSKNSTPDKSAILECLNRANQLLQGLGAVSGLVTAISKAVEMVGRVF